MTRKRVLITGGSGFIAGHCILQLLEQGYVVRTTIRFVKKEADVRAALADAGMKRGENLTFVAADLLSDAGWAEAVADIDVVLHAASPVQPGHVKNEDDLIVPAREGTLRVLRAAQKAGVARVVLTSAFHAVGWGHPHGDHTFTEDDWTILDGPGIDAYGKSKTLAERAAWNFMEASGGAMELVALLPVAVMGPVMGKEVSGSNHLIQSMLDGAMPALPNLFIPIVEVRDVAAAHVLALTTQAAAGERFLLSNGPALALKEIAALLRAELGDAARRVPSRSLPDFVVCIGSLFSSQMKSIAPDLGYAKKTTNEKAKRILGWTARAPREAIVSAAQSMVRKNLVKN